MPLPTEENSRLQPDRDSPEAAAIPPTMMAVVARHYGGSDALTIESVPTPQPTQGRLLVKVLASSANAYDWHMLNGTPYLVRLFAGLLKPKRPIQGSDVAGIVESIGADAVGFEVGDTVFGPGRGSFAEYTTVNPTLVAALPQGVTPEAAAATAMAGITALQALKTHGAMKPGDRVLINGAAGGVGTFAVQIAKALGAGHITAVCSTKNVEQARQLGATHVVDYLRDDVIALEDRYDVVVDIVGNRTGADIRSILAPGARYVGVSGPMANPWFGPMVYQSKVKRALRKVDASYRGFTAKNNGEDLAYLAGLLASGELVPVIDRIVGLDGVACAIDQIATGHGRGKIVIVPRKGLKE